jgi:hypothetical protein
MSMSMRMRHHMALIVLVCATLLSSRPALAQFAQRSAFSADPSPVSRAPR